MAWCDDNVMIAAGTVQVLTGSWLGITGHDNFCFIVHEKVLNRILMDSRADVSLCTLHFVL